MEIPSQAQIVFGFWNKPEDLAMMPQASLLPNGISSFNPSVTTSALPITSDRLITLSSKRNTALPSSLATISPRFP